MLTKGIFQEAACCEQILIITSMSASTHITINEKQNLESISKDIQYYALFSVKHNLKISNSSTTDKSTTKYNNDYYYD